MGYTVAASTPFLGYYIAAAAIDTETQFGCTHLKAYLICKCVYFLVN
ncbi:hypothetical protein Vi05172_g7051 [Venturia inaequalis]|nr:hypothetical protein Vi05172_g7051 [Venturia inaequalis]